MKIKTTLKTLTLSAILISFTACGGGDGSFEEETPIIEEPVSSTIEISVLCITDPTQSDIESYITLESGDSITKEGEVTIVTYHDSDGVKKVCKDTQSTGSAFVVKGEEM